MTTSPLGSPQRNLELQFGRQPKMKDTVLLSNESKKAIAFEKHMTAFLGTLDKE